MEKYAAKYKSQNLILKLGFMSNPSLFFLYQSFLGSRKIEFMMQLPLVSKKKTCTEF